MFLPSEELIFEILRVEAQIFMGLILLTFLRKIYLRFKSARENSLSKKYHQILERILKGERDDHDLLVVGKNISFRNFLSDIAIKLNNDSKHKITEAYLKLNFHLEDFNDLKSIFSSKRLRALHRISKLNIMIPQDRHLTIMQDNNYIIRFLAMELFITLYQDKSLFKLLSFIDQKSYQQRGLKYNLIEKYCYHDPNGIDFLFERTTDPDIEVALLTSAQKNNIQGLDEKIFKKVKFNSGKRVIVAALGTLKNYPSEKLFKLLMQLKTDSRWVIRLHVAKILPSLINFPIWDLLQELTTDKSYLVRLEAVDALLTLRSHDLIKKNVIMQIEKIAKDQNHPSFHILKYKSELENLRHDIAA